MIDNLVESAEESLMFTLSMIFNCEHGMVIAITLVLIQQVIQQVHAMEASVTMYHPNSPITPRCISYNVSPTHRRVSCKQNRESFIVHDYIFAYLEGRG